MFCCLVAIGALGFHSSQSAQMAVGILLVVSTLANMTTIGPVCYPIVAETPSGRLRYKTITIGRFVYNVTGIFSNSVTPRMLSATGKSPFPPFVEVIKHRTDTPSSQHGIGVPKQACSTPVRICSAISGAGSVCLRRRIAPLARLILCLTIASPRESSSTQPLTSSPSTQASKAQTLSRRSSSIQLSRLK